MSAIAQSLLHPPIAVLDALPVAVFMIDTRGQCLYVNRACQALTGTWRHMDELALWVLPQAGPPQSSLDAPEWHSAVQAPRHTQLRDPTGTPVRIHLAPLASPDAPDGYVGVIEELNSQQREAKEALLREKELLQATLSSIGDAVVTTDPAGKVNYFNPVAELMTEQQTGSVLGRPLHEVIQLVDEATRESLAGLLAGAPTGDARAPLPKDTLLLGSSGRATHVEASLTALHDQQGAVMGAVLVMHDVSEQRNLALKMAHVAQHDFLTRLPNRALLAEQLNQAIMRAERQSGRLALLFVDLDRFKEVNDSLGHALGDRLLQEVARRLVECTRASDIVSRHGGDEFVVLMSELEDPQAAAQMAQRLLSVIRAPFYVDGHELHLTVSVGVSRYPSDGLDAETLTKNADAAMYHAKQSGRDNSQFFASAMNERVLHRFNLERSLRRALSRLEFKLHYQPKVDLRSGNLVGVEALLRWHSEERGNVRPDEFIPVAEHTGLILPLGEWVLREACNQNLAWQREGSPRIAMAINVSPLQFNRQEFLMIVESALRETLLEANFLELELTESTLMRDVDQAVSMLQALKALGVRVSVDDFGTGYSSMAYLRQLPIDTLKIDKSFVRELPHDADDAAIVGAVISMARSLKRTVIAEGVENEQQLHWLREQGCHQMQGYYFCEPLPADQFAARFFRGDSLKTLPHQWLGHFRS